MKALVLAAGKGRRLRNSIGEISKCMIDLDGRPLLSYALDNAVKAKITEAVIVVGYKAETIMEYFGDEYQGMPLTYAFQKEQNGIIDAMESGIEALNGEDFLLLAGDELLFNPRHQEMIAEHYAKKSFITCGMVDKDDIETIKKTYTIQYNDDKIITKLVEKPQTVFNHLKGSCSCVFSGHIFDYKKDIGGGIRQYGNRSKGIRRAVTLLDEANSSCTLFCRRRPFCKRQFRRGSGTGFECNEIQKINLGDLINFWKNKGKIVRYHLVADCFVNVNFAEDLNLIRHAIGFK